MRITRWALAVASMAALGGAAPAAQAQETQAVVDIFVGFGGFTPRPAVKDKAMAYISTFHGLSSLLKSVIDP